MVRISVPPDTPPDEYLWHLAGPAGEAARAYSNAVHDGVGIGLREFEAARMRIAQLNRCAVCLDYRSARDNESWGVDPDVVPEDFYWEIERWRGSAALSPRERLAAEFAHRFATDHTAFETDEVLWKQLHEHFDDAELVCLAVCVGAFLSAGRISRIFGTDTACARRAR